MFLKYTAYRPTLMTAGKYGQSDHLILNPASKVASVFFIFIVFLSAVIIVCYNI